MNDRIWNNGFLLYTGPNRYCANCGKQLQDAGKGPQTCSRNCHMEFRFQPGRHAADLRDLIGHLLDEVVRLTAERDEQS